MAVYPEFTAVSSSNLNGVAYTSEPQVLYVEFSGGSRYKYTGVADAKELHDDIIESASPGSYFSDTIKGLYPYSRV